MRFNGKAKRSFVCSGHRSEKGLRVTFYDRNWNRLPFERHYPASETEIQKPQNYEKMVELAESAASKFPFVRADFYEIEGRLYFGELTLYPSNGVEGFMPEERDEKVGEWLDLD